MSNLEIIEVLKKILEEHIRTKQTILTVSKEPTPTLDKYIQGLTCAIEQLQEKK